MEYKWSCRKPQERDPFENVISPFSLSLWAVIIGTTLLMGNFDFQKRLNFMKTKRIFHVTGLALLTIYKIQSKIIKAEFRLRRNIHWTDWITFPLASMVSQDTLYWFRDTPRNSSGSVLVGIWTICNILIYLSYISNFQVISRSRLLRTIRNYISLQGFTNCCSI